MLELELGAETRCFFLDRDHPEALILANGSLPDQLVATGDAFDLAGTARAEYGTSSTPGTSSAYSSPKKEYKASAQTIAKHAWADEDAIGMLLRRATADVVVRSELEVRLRRGDKLRVKFGVDPTS